MLEAIGAAVALLALVTGLALWSGGEAALAESAQAEKDFARTKSLYEEKVAPLSQYEVDETRVIQSKAQEKVAETNVTLAGQSVTLAEISLSMAKKDLRDSVMFSPIDGIVSIFFMQLSGFTFNSPTMLALGLSVGTLVTNSIVVMESVAAQCKSGARSYDIRVKFTPESGYDQVREFKVPLPNGQSVLLSQYADIISNPVPVVITRYDKMRMAALYANLDPGFPLGMMPLAVANGLGSELQVGIGMSSVGGIVVSGVLTLIVIPAAFLVINPPKRGEPPPEGEILDKVRRTSTRFYHKEENGS